MSNNSVSSPRSASGSVHEQIETFLQTALQGQMGPDDQDRAEQKGMPGRPRSLPSVTLWMAVLVAVLRGLRSQRAIWRLIAAGGNYSGVPQAPPQAALEKRGNLRSQSHRAPAGGLASPCTPSE